VRTPRKFLGLGLSFKSHVAELRAKQIPITIPPHQVWFNKQVTAINGPYDPIHLPKVSSQLDYEGELGVVIGRTASRVQRAEALDYVFGYVPLLDITMRGEEDRSFRKSFDTFTPIGPEIVTADEVGNPSTLELELRLNGEVRQHARLSDLIHDVPRLIERYSAVMTLEPGDLIATGTPDGVGPLAPGDEIDLRIGGVGRLRMSVASRGHSERDWTDVSSTLA
jgi:2-keto-4-pentenoate hydratase/2-oxohepta-3-ene-1,7-dioic acid hydratase in catechol pathway